MNMSIETKVFTNECEATSAAQIATLKEVNDYIHFNNICREQIIEYKTKVYRRTRGGIRHGFQVLISWYREY